MECKGLEKQKRVAAQCLLDWEWCKERLRCKLINTERNQSLLEHIPYRSFLEGDLSIVYYVILDEEERILVQIRDDNLAYWGRSEEDLYYYGMKNVQKEDQLSIEDMRRWVNSGQGEDSGTKDRKVVCTNRELIFGAIMMTWDYALQQIQKKLGVDDYIIIPASVNEIICIPMQEEEVWERLVKVIRDMNGMIILQDKFLSNHLYGYVGGKLTILK
jgi:hypothetical protein